MADREQRSPNYAKVAGYYKAGLWTKTQVGQAVGRWITKDEAAAIYALREE